uniref:Neuregulin 2 n=1 Tax=Anolis carolinensis TaxID=28377 RepID=A0A803SKS2_ANOCA
RRKGGGDGGGEGGARPASPAAAAAAAGGAGAGGRLGGGRSGARGSRHEAPALPAAPPPPPRRRRLARLLLAQPARPAGPGVFRRRGAGGQGPGAAAHAARPRRPQRQPRQREPGAGGHLLAVLLAALLAAGILVKVLDLWPLNSGGLQREQLIRVGSTPAPCFRVKRNHRYIFFLEPTEQPLVFTTSFAPLDTSGKNLKKDVGRILCADCAVPPKLKKLRNLNAELGAKISLKCEASAGNPQPSYKWFKDGKELKKSKDIRIKYGNGKKNSRLQINKVKVEDGGEYSCEAENVLGTDTVRGTLSVRTVSTTLSSGPGHTRQCNETVKSYCVNGGVCYYVEGINQLSCRCPNEFTGDQCQNSAMASFSSMSLSSSLFL